MICSLAQLWDVLCYNDLIVNSLWLNIVRNLKKKDETKLVIHNRCSNVASGLLQ